MHNLLVSACLLGIDCRYDGGNCYKEEILELRNYFNFIPICPEQLGGLKTPRMPGEIKGNKVISKIDEDYSDNYSKGANNALKIALMNNCKYALLKQKSPSCGNGKIYDGSFSGKIIEGDGKTTELLKENGIICFNEEEIEKLLNLVIDKSPV